MNVDSRTARVRFTPARMRWLATCLASALADMEELLEASLRLDQAADLLDGMQCPASFTDRSNEHETSVCMYSVGHEGVHKDQDGAEWTGPPFYDLESING